MAAHSARPQRITDCPYAPFATFRRQHVGLIHFMFHAKAAGTPFDDSRLHRHRFSKRRRHVELRGRFNQWDPQQPVVREHFRFMKTGSFKQRVGAGIKKLEKPRKIHDSRRVAVAPFHLNLAPVAQHAVVLSQSRAGVYRIAIAARNPFFLSTLPIYTLSMQLLDGFFRSPAVEPLFSDTAAVQAILDFEGALARAQVRAGIIPENIAASIADCCRAELFDLRALGQAMPAAGNLAIPLLKQLSANVARNFPDAARYIHFGATSQDALDTGLVLQLRRATQAAQIDVDYIISTLIELTQKHRSTLLVARTWLQHALPTTFGFITAGWLDACLRHRQRLALLAEHSFALQFGGAAGTLAAFHDRGAQVSALLAEELQLPLARIPWHSHRERIGEVATVFGLLAGTLTKIARDLSLHMQTEVAELAEPVAPGRGGSSTMPHKHNPVACAAILAATSRVPPLVASALAALSGEYQRSLGPWQSEWEVIPEIARLTAGGSFQLAAVLPGITVDQQRMRQNLDLTHGLIYAEAVTITLSGKLNRVSAHKLVAAACQRAQSEKLALREVLSQEKEIAAILDAETMAQLFEPANYLGSANIFIDQVLAAARSPQALAAHTRSKG